MRRDTAAALLVAGTLAGANGAEIRFEEIGARAGARLTHQTRRFPGPHGDVLRMFTSGGAAAAAGDFNNDGLDDLFVTDSNTGRPNHLLRNEGGMRLTDVAVAAGVAGGNDPKTIVADALWFDYDNDGWRDLLVARFGTPLLYRNEKNGRFSDVSARAGLTKFGNTIAAVAVDYDNDGWLDLLLGNYFKPENLFDLKSPHVLPNDLDNAVNGGGVTLWRNGGKGVFTETTAAAGLDNQTGWILDVGHGDLNDDGWQDLYLAGDYGTDRVYFNQRNGTFKDVTKAAIGFDTKKGMNVEVADYDNDGRFDVYVTNITDEYMKECNMLWRNNGDGTFTDVSKETATCDTLWGWAAKFGDFDNDGWQDLYAVNGLRSAGPENYIPVLVGLITKPGVDFTDVRNWPDIGGMTWSGFQKKKLFRNIGGQTFKEMAAAAGVDSELDGRGIAVADFDRDGRLDMYVTNADQPALLYRNTTEPTGHWVALDLIGSRSNRDAIGARVTVRAGGRSYLRAVDGGNGYAGQSTRRVHVGLGTADRIESIEIRWPSGAVQKAHAVVDRITAVREK